MEYDGELSYYERCTLLAFLYFRDSGCEYAITEVGMWGRLDATNIITPIVSIITSISYDHMEFLGDTLEEIAWEKWGIIKPWIPVLLYGKNPTLQGIANNRWSPILFATERTVMTNLLGDHQISNARIAYDTGILLWINTTVIEQALRQVDHPGRLQYLRSNLLIDWAHNEAGMRELRKYIKWQKWNWENIVYSFNLKSGKSAHLVLDIFPWIDSWNIVKSNGWRVCDAQWLADEVEKLWKNTTILSPGEIFVEASKYPNTLFVVFGSLYMMGEFLGK
jgi:dihydrofolate synthase / folylpolyglutamate synthase